MKPEYRYVNKTYGELIEGEEFVWCHDWTDEEKLSNDNWKILEKGGYRFTDEEKFIPRSIPADKEVTARYPVDGGLKYDEGKAPMALLPGEALAEVAKVLGFGASKYDAHNWRKGFTWSRVASAALRHLFAWIGGENLDPESGISHLAHAACCVLFLLSFEINGTGEDDRHVSDE